MLCSKTRRSDPNERFWTWLEVDDLDVYGQWREYGACTDKTGVSHFRFRAFELDNSSTYGIMRERCRDAGYAFVQPARLNPEGPAISFGWPDRGYEGVHGPNSYYLTSGRPNPDWERNRELANDGWYVFRMDQDVFTPGFLSTEPCKRVHVMKEQFELHDLPCRDYRKCN